MTLAEPHVWRSTDFPVDQWLESLPQVPAVFLVWAAEGRPYLGRTNVLRRRLTRLLAPRASASLLLNLRDVAGRVEVWPTGSRLESSLISYELARRHFPDEYAKVLRLPKPPYVKLILSNRFARTQVTARLSGGQSRYFGPFRSRAAAEDFEKACLDLFQLRRCQEDLIPAPEHPGCIYGEMNMCLRPCQQAVSDAEYATEAQRVGEFLASGGQSLAAAVRASRDRLSEDMQFEEAARQHARWEKIQTVIDLAGEIARSLDRLEGVAVTRSAAGGTAVILWFLRQGVWCAPRELSLAPAAEGNPVPLDQRLREICSGLETPAPGAAIRQDHLALLSRWYFSSYRDGEWLAFEDGVPYRKLVNAIHRVAKFLPAAD